MDYYNLLGVRRTAHAEEIRTAFRRLAKRAHPDAHPNLSGEEKLVMHRQFIQLAHAYETLSDPARRAAYNRKLGVEPKAAPRPHSGASRSQSGASRAQSGASRRQSGASQRQSATNTAGRRTSARAQPSSGAASRPHSGASRSQSGASRTQSGAFRSQSGGGARPGRPQPPPPPEDSADLDTLMQDVQGLLDKFGLDMRQHFGEMLDKALDWALSVFVEVVAALDSDRAAQEKAPPQQQSPPSASSRAAPPRPASSDAGPAGESAQPPPNLDDELAALKNQVRSTGDKKRGRAPTSESVEEALHQIKEKAKLNP